MLRFLAEQLGGRPLFSLDFRQTFAALKHRNYRLWFIGQLVSLVGTWMQTTAQGYLVFQLTHSPAYLGYVGFATGVPSWLFMLYGGVVADRLSRRKLLLITQTSMMILAFILAALTFLGLVQPWQIVLLALGLGVANAFDAPARQAFVVEMVEREDLTNAIALNSSMFNLATVVGPAVAGLAYAILGPAWCFTINGVTFIAVITALLLMRLKPILAQRRTTAALDDLKEGVRYVASHIIIRTLVSTAAVISLFGLAFMTLMPAWATTVLGGDATTNGWLLGARGVGALSGALMIAALGRFKAKGRLLTMGSFVFPVLLLFFAQVRWLPLSLLALAGTGWGFMVLFNMANTLIQTLVPDELRGRVVSLYTLGFFGLMPLGALLAGWAAELIGEPNTIALSALISLGFAGWLWLRVPQLRALE
ncbi:MAG: MFS transporter [Chloroflexi bacterium]|nr:MFS transporter [Chloroflexota bacterium]